MNRTIPVRASADYGDIVGWADIAAGMDILDAAALLASHTAGGVPALAVRMGVSANTLQHKLNPNNVSHHLTLREALQLQQVTGLPYVLQAMAAALDYSCHLARPVDPDICDVDAIARAQQDLAELVSAVADARRRGRGGVSSNAARRIQLCAQEAMASINQLCAVAVRTEPEPVQQAA